MSLFFTRYLFLELFDVERILDEEIGDYEYSLRSRNLCFTLRILQCEEYASIKLKADNLQKYIFDIGLNNIDSIAIAAEKNGETYLRFFYTDTKKIALTIMIKPEISLQYHID